MSGSAPGSSAPTKRERSPSGSTTTSVTSTSFSSSGDSGYGEGVVSSFGLGSGWSIIRWCSSGVQDDFGVRTWGDVAKTRGNGRCGHVGDSASSAPRYRIRAELGPGPGPGCSASARDFRGLECSHQPRWGGSGPGDSRKVLFKPSKALNVSLMFFEMCHLKRYSRREHTSSVKI